MEAESLLPSERDSQQESAFRTANAAENKARGTKLSICFLSLSTALLRKCSVGEDRDGVRGHRPDRPWSLPSTACSGGAPLLVLA